MLQMGHNFPGGTPLQDIFSFFHRDPLPCLNVSHGILSSCWCNFHWEFWQMYHVLSCQITEGTGANSGQRSHTSQLFVRKHGIVGSQIRARFKWVQPHFSYLISRVCCLRGHYWNYLGNSFENIVLHHRFHLHTRRFHLHTQWVAVTSLNSLRLGATYMRQ